MTRDYFDQNLGEQIDGEWGVPVAALSCPGCGKKYKRQKQACTKCEECGSCCHCVNPNLVPVDDEFLGNMSDKA